MINTLEGLFCIQPPSRTSLLEKWAFYYNQRICTEHFEYFSTESKNKNTSLCSAPRFTWCKKIEAFTVNFCNQPILFCTHALLEYKWTNSSFMRFFACAWHDFRSLLSKRGRNTQLRRAFLLRTSMRPDLVNGRRKVLCVRDCCIFCPFSTLQLVHPERRRLIDWWSDGWFCGVLRRSEWHNRDLFIYYAPPSERSACLFSARDVHINTYIVGCLLDTASGAKKYNWWESAPPHAQPSGKAQNAEIV